MPLGTEIYLSFAEIARDLNHTSYNPQWSKTVECDRLINLIYDESLYRVGSETRILRLQAIAEYLGSKRLMNAEWFRNAPADVRLPTIFLTLGTVLSRAGEQQIGRCGRFHRALTAVWNESQRTGPSASNADKRAAYEIWLNNLVQQLLEDFNFLLPPTIIDTTAYRINQGDLVINDGSPIEVSAQGRLDLYTNGIGFKSVQWELDGSPVPGEIAENIRIDPVTAPDDAGVYTAVYTNDNGDTTSNTFTVAIT